MTVRDLVFGSLRLIGVLATGETPSDEEANDALLALNQMIDGFSTENLIIPAILREQFTCTAGQQTYSMGPGGNFNTVRPTQIQNASIVVLGSNPIQELPLKIISQREFQLIFVKSVQSNIPLWLYADNAYPNTNLNIWPVPQVNNAIVLWSLKPLAQFASLNDAVAVPPGVVRMLRYNLGVELAPEYGKNDLDEKIIAIADAAKADVKRTTNMNRPQYMETASELIGPRGSFNWIIGDTV